MALKIKKFKACKTIPINFTQDKQQLHITVQ